MAKGKRTRNIPSGPEMLIAGKEYRVLSLYPEWAWEIIHGDKDVEYRTWSTQYRGRILIHASSKRGGNQGIPRSAIIGAVNLVDCVTEAESDVHWLLRNPAPIEPIVQNVKGKLGLWRWTPTAKDIGAAPGSIMSGRNSLGEGSPIEEVPLRQRDTTRSTAGPGEQGSKRGIDDVPVAEVLAALRASGSRAANELGVLRAASRRLGFARMGARIEQVLRTHARAARGRSG